VLSDFHDSLRTLVYDRGQIAREDVEIAFDAPVKAWIGARTRPALSFFLFDVRENTELRQTAPETLRANGRGFHRAPPRRFDLRYVVSAVATVVEDEHLLLWRTLAVLMKHPTFPAELLPDAIRELGVAVKAKTAEPDETPRPLDVWSALESPPRPAFLYIATVPLDLELVASAPLVLSRTERFTRTSPPYAASADVRTAIGGHVRTRAGAPLAGARVTVDGRAGPHAITGAGGEFTLGGLSPGPVTLRIESDAGRQHALVPVQVPSDSYDIVTDATD
jgi:hypothetical protein